MHFDYLLITHEIMFNNKDFFLVFPFVSRNFACERLTLQTS